MTTITWMEVLWHIPSSGHPALCVLQRFEESRFIHACTKPTFVDAGKAPAILFHLPRFHLQFELHAGSSILRCSNYSGYYVPAHHDCGSAPDPADQLPLVRFRDFLLLHPEQDSMPIRALVPDGAVKQSPRLCSVEASTNSHDSELGHHVFALNKRTLGFDTTVVHSRLFLAAIYAATHSEVPLPQLGMTAGEHAVELLRRSWVNRPLSSSEADALSALASFSIHTPALQLLCRALLEESASLAFLHPEPGQQVLGDASTVRNALTAYQQQSRLAGPLPFVNPRRTLSGAEELKLMGRQRKSERAGTAHLVRSIEWDHLQMSCMEESLQQQTIQCRHSSLSKQISQELYDLREQVCHTPRRHAKAACADISTAHLENDAHGRDVAADLQASMRVFASAAADLHVEREKLTYVAGELERQLEVTTAYKKLLQDFLLRALAHCPAGALGTAMQAFQHAAVVALPAQADLLRMTIFPAALSVRLCTFPLPYVLT